MLSRQIYEAIKTTLPDAAIDLEGEECSFKATVICASFTGLSTVKRQQQVLGCVHSLLTSGTLHALSVDAYTPDEWDARNTGHLVSIEM